MDYKKLLGIIFIVLGLIFVFYPMVSSEAVSWIAGICLIAFGFASIIDGFSILSIVTHFSAIEILLGICAILLGILFIYEIDALSFILAFQFYLIAFVLVLFGLIGLVSPGPMLSKVISLLILIMGILVVVCAFYSLSQPLYAAIFVGICLILEGIAFCTTGITENS